MQFTFFPSCLRMPGQGATRATQRPLSRLFSLPLRSTVPFPVTSGCQDTGPPGPLNAPCPGFSAYLSVAPFLSQSAPDAWTGGHRGHSTPLVQTFLVTFQQAAGYKQSKVPEWSRGDRVLFGMVGTLTQPTTEGHLCFLAGKILALKTPPTYWPT